MSGLLIGAIIAVGCTWAMVYAHKKEMEEKELQDKDEPTPDNILPFYTLLVLIEKSTMSMEVFRLLPLFKYCKPLSKSQIQEATDRISAKMKHLIRLELEMHTEQKEEGVGKVD